MKIQLTYSNSIKAAVVIGFVAVFYLLMFIMFNIFNVPENLVVNAGCGLSSNDTYKCLYTCVVNANCKYDSLTQRVMVLHSGSIAIFDKLMNVSCGQNKISFDIPMRNYSYDVRFILFNDKYYGKSEGYIVC